MEYLCPEVYKKINNESHMQVLVWGQCFDPNMVQKAFSGIMLPPHTNPFPWRAWRRPDGILAIPTNPRNHPQLSNEALESIYMHFAKHRNGNALGIALRWKDATDLCCSGWKSDITIWHSQSGGLDLPNATIANGFGRDPFVVGATAHERLDDIASLAQAQQRAHAQPA